MLRKLRLVVFVFFFFIASAAHVPAMDRTLWESYKERFLSEDGRIIDRANRQISHSEGQGYGLILALSAGDRPTFEKILEWTRNNLQVRGKDRLLAWSWGQRPNGQWDVLDFNNATDADLLVAYALMEASERWNEPSFRSAAMSLVQDIKKHLLVDHKGMPILLPGYYGFDKEHGLVVNLSYYVYPALEVLSRADDQSLWQRVIRGGLGLLQKAARTPWNLPPDWILIRSDGIEVYGERSSRFGYEAIRIPLYLAWAGHKEALTAWSDVLNWFDKTGTLPLWVDVVDPAVSVAEAPGGFYAVWAAVADRMDRPKTAKALWDRAQEKILQEKNDYYSSTLYLLSLINLEKR